MEDAAQVELSFPPATRYLRVARLTATGLASDLGFDVDELEDLRVAVDELCAVLIGDDGGPSVDGDLVRMTYRHDDGVLEVSGERTMPSADPPVLDPIARELLAVVTDEHSVDHDGRIRRVRLRKRPQG